MRALSCNVPLSVVIDVTPPGPVTETEVTEINWFEIVIISVPKIPEPSLAVALAVTVPLSIAVTRPLVLIIAWPVPLTSDQVTDLTVAFTGITSAVN